MGGSSIAASSSFHSVIVVIFGTTGELIKIAPILKRLDERSLPYVTISTNQQVSQIPDFQNDLGLRRSDFELTHGRRGNDLERPTDIPGWVAEVTRSFLGQRRSLQRRLNAAGHKHAVMVHGDTMTTVLGALIGRALRFPVTHLEAGMRSGNWRNPFPEELDRIIAGFLATIHYAGSDREVDNLNHARGRVIKIGANTVFDSIKMVPEGLSLVRDAMGSDTLFESYGLVSLHRSELLSNRERLKAILIEISRAPVDYPLLFIDHPVTVHALRKHGLDHMLSNGQVTRVPRLRYTAFIQLLRQASFILTDSGGCQEECFYLDVPCLIHRLVTERAEGLGKNVVLTKYDLHVVRSFLSDPELYRIGEKPQLRSPSDVVVADLVSQGFWAPA